MPEPTIREYALKDIPAMKKLWREVFGDPQTLIDDFFSRLPDMGTAVVAELEGGVFGAAYVIVGQELIEPGKLKRPVCGYIYAVAVESEHRRLGLGAALCRAAEKKARERGAGIVCTLPAEPSLYGWYKTLLGFEPVLYRQRHEIACEAIEPAMKLSSTEYMLWRENMLRDKTHLHPSNYTLDFARCFYEDLGGGLFACGSGICAAYTEGGTAFIKELITETAADCGLIAASVGALLGADRAVFYLPADKGDTYIAAAPGSIPAGCVWNLSFD